MRKPRFALVLLLFLVLGVSLSVPAEDVPETSYDESETLPCEGTPVFSIEAPEAVAGMPVVPECVSSLGLDTVARRCESYWKHRTCGTRANVDPLTILNISLRC
jgi:hypothetical protein